MNGRDGDLDDKDAVLLALLHLQRDVHASELATALVWLSLWPGLDSIYRRHLRHYPSRHDELASDLSSAFVESLTAFRPDRVLRVAATLVMNTERRLRDGIFVKRKPQDPKRQTRAAREQHVLEDIHHLQRQPPASESGREVLQDLRRFFARLGPLDGALLYGRLIDGRSTSTLASKYGLSTRSVRQRLDRAMRRLDALRLFSDPLVNKEKRNRQPRCHIPTAGGAFASQRASNARRRK